MSMMPWNGQSLPSGTLNRWAALLPPLPEAFGNQSQDFGRNGFMDLLERDYGLAPSKEALRAPVEGKAALATAVRLAGPPVRPRAPRSAQRSPSQPMAPPDRVGLEGHPVRSARRAHPAESSISPSASTDQPPTNPPKCSPSLPEGAASVHVARPGRSASMINPPAGRWLQAPPGAVPGVDQGEDHRLKRKGRAALSLEFKLPQSQPRRQQFFAKPTPASSASPLRAMRHPGASDPAARPSGDQNMARNPSKPAA